MDIMTYGEKVLREPALPVDEINDDIRDLALRMQETMYNADGVGLAAPQLGVSIRLIVLGVPAPDQNKITLSTPGELLLLPRMPMALINPEITIITENKVSAEEGCLSVPRIYAHVSRPDRILLSAIFLDGEKINVECGGFLARAIQHEVDHLDGVLFVDRLDEDEKAKIKADLKQLKKDKKAELKNKKKES